MPAEKEPSDEKLVLACRRGEAAAWEALVLRYQRLIYAIPRRACLSEDQAADVFQTVFARLVEMDLIGRVPSPMPRQVCFQFRPGGWAVFVRQRLKLWASLHEIAEHGLDLLQGKDPALRDRLEEAHDMFSLIEDELPALLERVETRRRG